MATSDLDPDLDALFQLPLEQFTDARNALSARLKKAGRGDDAALVKALPKPSASAWAINKLYWGHRGAFERLLESSTRVRDAQAAQLAGQPSDLRSPLAARGSALTELTRGAAATLRGAGHLPTPVLMRRLTLTLEALSAYAEPSDDARAGRLTKDIDPPGFDSLAALVPRVGGMPKASGTTSKVLSFDRPPVSASEPAVPTNADERRQMERARKLARQAATEGLEAAEAVMRSARAALKIADDKVREAAAHVKATDADKLRAEQALDRVSAIADESRQHARGLSASAAEAASTLADAERVVDDARAELSRFDTD